MAKIIRNLNIDLSDMAANGGNRAFSIEGDVGAIFSMEIKNEDSYYYNFDTNTFAAAKSRLKQKAVGGNGKYSGSILFPSISDNDQYDIYLFAEAAHDTEHIEFNEVRFGDDSLDINSSRGSNSSLLQKVIYQYTDTTITIDPRYTYLSGDAPNWFLSRVVDTIVVGRGKNSGKQSFSCTVLAPTNKAIKILRQPDINDFIKELDVKWELSTATNGSSTRTGGVVPIQGEDPWASAASRETTGGDPTGGQTRGSSALNMAGGVAEGVKLIVDAVPTNTQIGDRLTGWLHDTSGSENSLTGDVAGENQVVLISALNPDGDNANEFTVDVSKTDQESGLTIADNHPLFFNAPYYYRYKTKASRGGYGVLGLKTSMKEPDGMTESYPTVALGDAGATRPNTLGPYEDFTTYTLEIVNDDGSVTEQTNTTVNISYPAIDTTGFKPTITNGKVTAQDGVVTFTSPQKIDTAISGVEGGTWILARGTEWIEAVHNTEVKITNLKFELTAPTTTTTSAVSNSTSIPVADREGVINGVSTISGIGIDSSVANPTIASGGGADGAGTWVASAAQTLESGITLTVNGTSRNVTITGDIEVTNCGDSDFTIIMDIVGPLTGG